MQKWCKIAMLLSIAPELGDFYSLKNEYSWKRLFQIERLSCALYEFTLEWRKTRIRCLKIDRPFNPAICKGINFLKKSQKINVVVWEIDCIAIHDWLLLWRCNYISMQSNSAYNTIFIFWFLFKKFNPYQMTGLKSLSILKHCILVCFFFSVQRQFVRTAGQKIQSKTDFFKAIHFSMNKKW